jgi:ubiquinone/menaquinone biosynthesis C-methylase UbiE
VAEFLCPWWVGYLLLNPFRKVVQSAKKTFGYCLSPGMTVLEVGPGMGFFSLDVARIIGPQGRLVCVDVQRRMIEALRARAARAGLLQTIEARLCAPNSLGVDDLNGVVDLALVLFVAHEVHDRPGLFRQIRSTLKPDGRLFLAEPKAHVNHALFDEIEAAALEAGFNPVERPRVFRARAALMAAR